MKLWKAPKWSTIYYNFEKLNIPANHPAKDEQDTFYINKDIVLRTQTSPVQARIMEQGKLPIRMIAPGRVFRSDEVDATHSPSFHQIEGLVVDKNITFADLKGTLAEFAKELFGRGDEGEIPSPSLPVHGAQCGGGCNLLQMRRKGLPFLQGLPAGLRSSAAVWYIPMYLKCAVSTRMNTPALHFGVGLERIALLKYEIDDMRLLYENDIRFLKQF